MTVPHILVVDDDPTNLMVACATLQRLGYTTETATDGIEALRAASDAAYVAVIMDCMMPNMDGYAATRGIHAYDRRSGRAHTPIIGLSALASMHDRKAAVDAGMDAYLTKPLSVIALIEALRACGVASPSRSGPA